MLLLSLSRTTNLNCRTILRHRHDRRHIIERRKTTTLMMELSEAADVPSTVGKIPSRGFDHIDGNTNAVIIPMGNSRRMFLLNPYLDAEDFESAAYRIRALTKNPHINSILIADGRSSINGTCLPRFISKRNDINFNGVSFDTEPEKGHTWYVAGGYDPYKIASFDDSRHTHYLLDSLRKLSLAVQGYGTETKIPVITLPHGAITDGGYALCMGSYVLATSETSLSLLNPSRGLSFDPIGFSYILPRLSSEHENSERPSTCGMIIALAKYEADCDDMIETGLASHLVGDSGMLPILEEELATLGTWDQQGLVKKRKTYYGNRSHNLQQQNYLHRQLARNPSPSSTNDVNRNFRNFSIAQIVDQVSDVSADSFEDFPFDYTAIYENGYDDASLDTDHVPYDLGFFSSRLLAISADLDYIFREEESLEGLIDMLKQEASAFDKNSNLNSSRSIFAKNLVDQMEKQCPLALHATYALMKLGNSNDATMQSCMIREANVQKKLMNGPDFKVWLNHIDRHGGDVIKAPLLTKWKHSSVKDVSKEEVEDLLS